MRRLDRTNTKLFKNFIGLVFPPGLINPRTSNYLLDCNKLFSGLSRFLGKSFSITSEAILSHVSQTFPYFMMLSTSLSPIFVFPPNIHHRFFIQMNILICLRVRNAFPSICSMQSAGARTRQTTQHILNLDAQLCFFKKVNRELVKNCRGTSRYHLIIPKVKESWIPLDW